MGGTAISLSNFQTVTESGTLSRIPEAARGKVMAVNLRNYGISHYGKLNPWGWTTNWYSSASFSNVTKLDEIAAWMGYTPNLSEPELFIDGQAGILARYPNGGEMTEISAVTDTGVAEEDWCWFKIDDYGNALIDKQGPLIPWEDMKSITVQGDETFRQHAINWSTAPDIWAYGYWQYNWADLASHVRSVDSENGSITLQHPVWEGAARVGQRFYVYNLLEELDVPGEWYLERETGMLYLYPLTETDAEISLSLLEDNMVTMNRVSNVTIENMEWKYGRKDAFVLQNCQNINIRHCDVGFVGNRAVVMQGDCRNINVSDNVLHDMKDGGVTTSGGDYYTLAHSDNVVENNHIYRYARSGSAYASAIRLGGIGDAARHNEIHDGDSGCVIALSAAYTTFEYNEIYDVMRKMADSGIIYNYQSVTAPGKTVRNNYFHDIASDETQGISLMGVYVDGMGHDCLVTQNIFKNFGGYCIFFNGGWSNTATDNIVINSMSLGRYTSIGAEGGEGAVHEENQMKAVQEALAHPAYQNFGKLREWLNDDNRMLPKYNVVKNNVLINTEDFAYAAFSNVAESAVKDRNDIQTSLMFQTDPGFKDIAAGNYELRADSAIYTSIPGFNAPEFQKMGRK